MAQAKALDALEPFLALSKSATSARAAVDLVERATSHPNTFVFAELLQTPQVQALATAEPQYASYLTLLKIFSYGTYADYRRGALPSLPVSLSTSAEPPSTSQSAASPLPPLSPAQIAKLRQLSLISLATDRASMGYTHLIRELYLQDASELESLVISAVYAGLISAVLDPACQVVRISSVAALRDLPPGALPRLRTALQQWSGRCEEALADLDGRIAEIRRRALATAEEERRWDAVFNRAVEDEKAAVLKQTPDTSGTASGYVVGGGELDSSALGKKTVSINVSALSPGMVRGKQRFMKRSGGSGSVAIDADMDVDIKEVGDAETNKRASRRKL